MTTPTTATDSAVEDLRRRARRRLVGAIVLALAAAVLVPMLLESDPRPLGDDVSVRIPPVDQGKFVNRINTPGQPASGDGKVAEAKPDAKSAVTAGGPIAAAPAPATPPPPPAAAPGSAAAPPAEPATAAPARRSISEAEQRVLAPTSKPIATGSSTAASSPGAQVGTPAPAALPSPVKAPEKVAPDAAKPDTLPADAKVAAASGGDAGKAGNAKPATDAKAPPADAAAKEAVPPSAGTFAVQLAAFADDKGANALAAKLKKAGYAAYTEPLNTSRGTLWRVRVGPYPTREAADAARAKLKDSGQNGIVTASR